MLLGTIGKEGAMTTQHVHDIHECDGHEHHAGEHAHA